MKVILNGEPKDISQRTLNQLFTSLYPDCDVAIIDGKEAKGHVVLKEKMVIYIGKSPSGKGDLNEAITARDAPGIRDFLKKATVGIAGAGGLGSNIAAFLARSGVGRIIIADFDKVDLGNLNRQNYFVGDLGHFKAEITASRLKEMNPAVETEFHNVKLDEKNIPRLFAECDVICEAFDDPEAKAMILSAVSEKLPDKYLVCGSGMAGIEDTEMKVTQFSERIFICGDGTREYSPETGIMAPRVNMCAGIMANKVLQLLSD